MLIKKYADHFLVKTPTCGELREILKDGEYAPLGIAIAIEIRPTLPHYHLTFDEIYFMLDGEIDLLIYDPSTEEKRQYTLGENELLVITKGLHHQITRASPQNRLCVISAPPFQADDEHPSQIL